jgi:four helix bundle protein
MEKAKKFTDLILWQKSHTLKLLIYNVTKCFPKEEIFGLVHQFRKAAISIPANIAEGFRKKGKPDKVRFLNIAEGSLEECKYYIILSRDLNYCQTDDMSELADEVGKLLNAYSKAILN